MPVNGPTPVPKDESIIEIDFSGGRCFEITESADGGYIIDGEQKSIVEAFKWFADNYEKMDVFFENDEGFGRVLKRIAAVLPDEAKNKNDALLVLSPVPAALDLDQSEK